MQLLTLINALDKKETAPLKEAVPVCFDRGYQVTDCRLFATTKSSETNSIVFVGCRNILPLTVLFSTSACVVVEESMMTLKRSRPARAWILWRRGVTAAENLARVASRLGSKMIV